MERTRETYVPLDRMYSQIFKEETPINYFRRFSIYVCPYSYQVTSISNSSVLHLPTVKYCNIKIRRHEKTIREKDT